MLRLWRRLGGQPIHVGNYCLVTALNAKTDDNGKTWVELGISAPANIPIYRGELRRKENGNPMDSTKPKRCNRTGMD